MNQSGPVPCRVLEPSTEKKTGKGKLISCGMFNYKLSFNCLSRYRKFPIQKSAYLLKFDCSPLANDRNPFYFCEVSTAFFPLSFLNIRLPQLPFESLITKSI